MQLGCADRSVPKSNLGNAFPLSPSTSAIDSPKACLLSYTGTGRYRLDGLDVSKDLEIHFTPYQQAVPLPAR